ncbi:hypothetical protein DITRI_Ditri12bG0070400 [Diplodiscus trichospermus]
MAFSSTLLLYSNPRLVPNTTSFITKRCYSRSNILVVTAVYGAEGSARRRVYKQSQSEQLLTSAPEKLLSPKPSRSSSVENKSPSQGVKLSFAPGTNLLSDFAAKIDRQSKQMLNEFAKELRAFSNVDMSGSNFGNEELFFLLRGWIQSDIVLKTLNLSGNHVGDDGVKVRCLFQVIYLCVQSLRDILVNNGSIQKLQLNSVDLGDEGITSLAGALLENNAIRNLHLNDNYGGALGANALAKGLDKSLRELHLHGNSIGDGVHSLILGLSSHKAWSRTSSLIENFEILSGRRKNCSCFERKLDNCIDLCGNNIRAKGVGVIAEALKDYTVITNLEQGYNPIGTDGAKVLSEVLKFHGNVKTLKLGWCQIGPKGAEFIADMLRYNNTISILDLRAKGLRDHPWTLNLIFLLHYMCIICRVLPAWLAA